MKEILFTVSMNESEIQQLARHGHFDRQPLHGQLEETHISWVILSRSHAFKIKKPVKLDFLDFSTLALRKHYCEREIALNSRFSPIYLDVQPVWKGKDGWHIGQVGAEVADYAVCMKRMSSEKRMDHQLNKKGVKKQQMVELAEVIAGFHRKAEKIFIPFDPMVARDTFNDINDILDFTRQHLGPDAAKAIERAIIWSNHFIDRHQERFRERIEEGWKRDVHGDLHSGNIFLYKTPVLFDCIEFNDEYRQIDLLYEIAFLCMDLEAFHRPELEQIFLREYLKRVHCIETREDEMIFRYFKSLRANVRAKVSAIRAMQQEDDKVADLAELKKYLALMEQYIEADRKAGVEKA